MKQTYMKPSTEVLTVKVQQQMLAGSPNALFDSKGTTDVMEGRRGRNNWDDEEDDY